jgi:hypothetical protein
MMISSPCYLFVPGNPKDLTQHSYENTVIWLYGHMSYWIVGIAFNVKDIYRRPFYTNKLFCLYMIFLFILLTAFLFNYDGNNTNNNKMTDKLNLEMTKVPNSFYTSMFFLFLFQTGLAIGWEIFIVHFVLTKFQLLCGGGGKNKKYGLLVERNSSSSSTINTMNTTGGIKQEQQEEEEEEEVELLNIVTTSGNNKNTVV